MDARLVIVAKEVAKKTKRRKDEKREAAAKAMKEFSERRANPKESPRVKSPGGLYRADFLGSPPKWAREYFLSIWSGIPRGSPGKCPGVFSEYFSCIFYDPRKLAL